MNFMFLQIDIFFGSPSILYSYVCIQNYFSNKNIVIHIIHVIVTYFLFYFSSELHSEVVTHPTNWSAVAIALFQLN